MRGRPTLECPESLETVSVPMLLFGLDTAAQPSVDEKLHELLVGQKALAAGERDRFEAVQSEMHELVAPSQRDFTFQFNAAHSAIDSACPRIFSLVPAAGAGWTAKLLGQKATLHLHCEEPGCWHLIEGANYDFKINAKWLRAVAPYPSKLVGALKYAAPLVAPSVGMAAAPLADALKRHIKMMAELAKRDSSTSRTPRPTNTPRRSISPTTPTAPRTRASPRCGTCSSSWTPPSTGAA